MHEIHLSYFMHRNTILKGIHNFIHLNLAIALFLALLVFVSGIEPATENRVSYQYFIPVFVHSLLLNVECL